MFNKYRRKWMKEWCGETLFFFCLSFFLSCANPFSTAALHRINRALKNSDTSEVNTKAGKKTDDKDRYITSVGKQMNRKSGWLLHTDMSAGVCKKRKPQDDWTRKFQLIPHAHASWFHWPIKTCQQRCVMWEWQGGSSLTLSHCLHFYNVIICTGFPLPNLVVGGPKGPKHGS